MTDPALLALFVPTFFFVSLTPGMCMTLALTLGMTLGIRKTLWMMAGELLGVGVVSVTAVLGAAALVARDPDAFGYFKGAGGAYLAFVGIQLWMSRGRMSIRLDADRPARPPHAAGLAIQGFVTAVANPKAWAFMIALLPPFIRAQSPLAPQLAVLIALILVIEFTCLMIYASGGKVLGRFLQSSGHVRILNRLAGTLMIGVGVWLGLL